MFAFLLLTFLLKVVTFYSRDVTFNLNSNTKQTITYLHLHETHRKIQGTICRKIYMNLAPEILRQHFILLHILNQINMFEDMIMMIGFDS